MPGKRKYPDLKFKRPLKRNSPSVQAAIDRAEVLKLLRYLLQYRPARPFGYRRYRPADRALAKKIQKYM